MALVFGNPWPKHSARAAKWLLQIAVVGLGFSLSLAELWRAGRVAVVLTLLAISLTIAVGLWLGRRFGVTENTGRLITVGTAICGGSAIAAVAPILRADEDEIGAALATVFTLNAVALFLFPYLGAALDLSEPEFGFWAALSIHDTSSVVAAGTVYGSTALAVATLVKLTRAAWLAPLALAAAARFRSAGRVSFPWFILGFLAAAVVASTLPQHSVIWAGIVSAARHALVVTLFLIGTGMTRAVLARVGARPLLFGTVLWLLVAAGSLLLVTSGLPLH